MTDQPFGPYYTIQACKRDSDRNVELFRLRKHRKKYGDDISRGTVSLSHLLIAVGLSAFALQAVYA